MKNGAGERDRSVESVGLKSPRHVLAVSLENTFRVPSLFSIQNGINIKTSYNTIITQLDIIPTANTFITKS